MHVARYGKLNGKIVWQQESRRDYYRCVLLHSSKQHVFCGAKLLVCPQGESSKLHFHLIERKRIACAYMLTSSDVNVSPSVYARL